MIFKLFNKQFALIQPKIKLAKRCNYVINLISITFKFNKLFALIQPTSKLAKRCNYVINLISINLMSCIFFSLL